MGEFLATSRPQQLKERRRTFRRVRANLHLEKSSTADDSDLGGFLEADVI